MAVAALAGARVRERRLALGLRQAAVARAAGISAAYLNLIEHDRRRVGAEVLDRLAAALGVSAPMLTGGEDAALLDDLRAAAASGAATPRGGEVAAEMTRAVEFLSRFPGWATLVASQGRKVVQLSRAVEALEDRIGQDPHLSAAIHEVLSAVSSVRSTAAILAETEDIAPEWRRRFHANLHQDSERLAAGAEALVAYLDAAEGDEAMALAPQEEVEAWLAARGWHLPEVEANGPGAAALEPVIADLASGAARRLAGAWVAEAARDAAAMPLAAFAPAAAETGGDPVRLGRLFGCGPVAAMRRLATMPGSALGLVLCDASGAPTFRKAVAGFPLPRGGAACPLWPLYAALGRPGMPVTALGELPGLPPRRYRLRAYAEAHHPQGFDGPEVRLAAMLIAPEGPPGAAPPVLRLGGTCRICPRDDCAARREPSILTEAGAAGLMARQKP